jgi:hypothetical protein
MSPVTQLGPVSTTGLDSDAANETSTQFRQIVTEAYVVNVGPSIANLESRDMDGLRQRILANGGVNEEEWSWVQTMVSSLV